MDAFIISSIPFIIGIFGLIVGSFLNVVILRHGSNLDLGGRSHCPQCRHQLRWYELIPVVSFVIQMGKCRNCKKPISWQYASVELLTALLFFISARFFLSGAFSLDYINGLLFQLFAFLIVLSFAIIITVYDIKNKLVPTVWFLGLVISSIVYFVISYIVSPFSFDWHTIVFHIAGLSVAVPFLAIWLISKGKWIGFADIEIIAWMGLFFGIISGTSAVLAAFYMGALFGLLFVVYKLIRGYSYKSLRKVQIPFGPFLLIAWLCTMVFSWNIFSLLSGLFM